MHTLHTFHLSFFSQYIPSKLSNSLSQLSTWSNLNSFIWVDSLPMFVAVVVIIQIYSLFSMNVEWMSDLFTFWQVVQKQEQHHEYDYRWENNNRFPDRFKHFLSLSLSLFQVKTLTILSLVFKTEYKVNQPVFSCSTVNNRKLEELHWKRYYFRVRVSSGIKPKYKGCVFSVHKHLFPGKRLKNLKIVQLILV